MSADPVLAQYWGRGHVGVLDDGLTRECAVATFAIRDRFDEAKARARSWDLPERGPR